MAVHIPKDREVLGCFFEDSSDYAPPEICKERPVVVLSVSQARHWLALVVPLSTTPPENFQPWHHSMSSASTWDRRKRWAKCDIIHAVSYDRLSAWRLGGRDSNGKRKYLHNFFVSDEDFRAIQAGVSAALKLNTQK